MDLLGEFDKILLLRLDLRLVEDVQEAFDEIDAGSHFALLKEENGPVVEQDLKLQVFVWML